MSVTAQQLTLETAGDRDSGMHATIAGVLKLADSSEVSTQSDGTHNVLQLTVGCMPPQCVQSAEKLLPPLTVTGQP